MMERVAGTIGALLVAAIYFVTSSMVAEVRVVVVVVAGAGEKLSPPHRHPSYSSRTWR